MNCLERCQHTLYPPFPLLKAISGHFPGLSYAGVSTMITILKELCSTVVFTVRVCACASVCVCLCLGIHAYMYPRMTSFLQTFASQDRKRATVIK